MSQDPNHVRPSPHTHQSSDDPDRSDYKGRQRFEHWYRDNQVYFITARVAGRKRAFASEQAKAIFWERFELYTHMANFTPWITCLLANHYHTLGYIRHGPDLKTMMKGLHGSTAMLVNDLLASAALRNDPSPRIDPFWSSNGQDTYFDGCVRDGNQARKAYRYIERQPRRHRLGVSCESYPHTRRNVPLERALTRAQQLNAYLESVPFKRYQG